MSNITGTIIKGVGGAYTVATDRGVFTCAARGIFRNKGITPLVGDKVEIEPKEEKTGVLHTVLPRKNELIRPKVANVDQAIITMAAAHPTFDRGLLDRFLLMAEYAGITPVICVNKWDLRKKNVPYSLYAEAGYPMVFTSYKDGTGLETLREASRDKVSVLAGPSGAGKSSLINWLGGLSQETGELSAKIKRGKHTTRHTELLPLKPSGFCVDTPGFTSLDISMIPTDAYAALYREFAPFLGRCRFSDCAHVKEQDCAVKAQVGRAIHPLRYESYTRFLQKGSV